MKWNTPALKFPEQNFSTEPIYNAPTDITAINVQAIGKRIVDTFWS